MKIETKTIHYVNYNDVDKAINEFLKEKGVLKPDFEFAVQEESGNDTSHEFSVGLRKYYMPDDEEKQEIIDGDDRSTSSILNWMCDEGKIPAGEYIIKVSW